jgi:16S rRNA processing protein RimM
VLSLAGVTDRTAAEALRGTLLVVDVDPGEQPDDPDEFYDHQLVGLAAVDLAGAPLGEVADVLHLPAQDLLAVRAPDGRELLVPFVAAIVPTVDLAAGRVVVDPPPGLFTLDGDR